MVQTNTLEKSAIVSPGHASPRRIESIDILRALTMMLMIFVNDLGSIKDAPQWMKHVAKGVDGMGLADVVYPAFIFIVGMSLFFAIKNRRIKGDDNKLLLRYVSGRTAALLIMGLFLVNGETINAQATGISARVWNVVCCLSFILIWNFYRRSLSKVWKNVGRGLGLLVLLTLPIIFRGGKEGEDLFAIQWWGILGGIAWAYFASALILIYSGENFYRLLGFWTFFCLLSMAVKAHLVPQDGIMAYIPNPIRGGTFVGIALGGVLTSFILNHYRKTSDHKTLTFVLLLFTAILIVLSVYTRSFWGISKLDRTPAWLFLCSALTILTFLIIYWITDVKRSAGWFDFVKPAGTDTLLCYLVPYLFGGFLKLSGFKWPGFMLEGPIGLLKCLLFALVCIWITKGLNSAGIRLKL